MVGHEIFGLLATIVTATAVLAAFRGGSQTSQVLSSGFNGFAGLLTAMQGNAGTSTTG